VANRSAKKQERREPGFGSVFSGPRLDPPSRGERPVKPAAGKGAPKGPSKRNRTLASFVLKWTLVLGVWGLVVFAGALAWFAYTLPDISGINTFNRRPSMTFIAADGAVVATYGDLYGGAVDLKDMPPHLPQAVLATEDRRFYSHFGLDPMGIARALYVNITHGRVVQGGSTITQQLAKNVFLTNERTIPRKIQEVMLALWLEHKFSKNQILTIYLNRVYLGAGTYGVEAASRRYFGKSAKNINPLEAAIIAGLLKAPSRYAPTGDLTRSKARAAEVLSNMVEAGFMSPQDATLAAREKLVVAGGSGGARGVRYFTDWLVDQLPGFIGYIDRDVTIVTTLDARLQRVAEAETVAMLAKDAKADASQAAVVVMSPDGAVRAMVGGRDYGESQFNRAVTAQRQPGSSFKPFVFLAAVENGLKPDDMLSDAPVTIGTWTPRNFDNNRYGQLTARDALARSVNTSTVRLAQQVGIDKVVATARRLGVTSELRRDLSTALGASEVNLVELTAAFAPFANGGAGVLPYAVVEIRDSSGKPLYRRSGSGPGRVVARPALIAMTDMMAAVMAKGTGRAAALDRPAAGKTGTSQDYRDAWFLGFTADYVAGVWFGNDDGDPMNHITGGTLPARLWKTIMTEAHQGVEPHPLPGLPSFWEKLDSWMPGSSGAGTPASQPSSPSRPAHPYAAPPGQQNNPIDTRPLP
jgi:penicillin-binding protein 1A